MKKKKYSLTISSNSEHALKCFHSFMVEDGEQQIIIPDEKAGETLFYSDIEWNSKNRKDLDLTIEMSDSEYE